jgi:hypothetical protein
MAVCLRHRALAVNLLKATMGAMRDLRAGLTTGLMAFPVACFTSAKEPVLLTLRLLTAMLTCDCCQRLMGD